MVPCTGWPKHVAVHAMFVRTTFSSVHVAVDVSSSFTTKKNNTENINFQSHALRKNEIRKRNRKTFCPPPSPL